MSVQAAPSPGASPGVVHKQVELPWSKAVEFAMKSIKIRFWRSMITAGGIFLGIAFLASVLTDKAVKGPNIEADELARINEVFPIDAAAGTRYPEAMMKSVNA